MLAALADDRVLLAPTRTASSLDGERFAWWQIDLGTGETVGVIDSGLHGVTIIEWVQTDALWVKALYSEAMSGASEFMQLAFFVEVTVVLAAVVIAAVH